MTIMLGATSGANSRLTHGALLTWPWWVVDAG